MPYPNASKGLRRIIIAEIVALAAALITVILSAIAFADEEASGSDSYSFGVISIVMLVIISLYIASYVLEISGILSASRDEPAFRVSLYAIIAALVLTVLSGFFYENETISFILAIGGDVAQFFLVHYIIHGIMHLSNHLGRPEMSKKGTHIFRVIYIAIIFEVIVRIFEMIYGRERGEALALPFGVIANILKSAEYILFMIFILKGNRMLKDSKAESN